MSFEKIGLDLGNFILSVANLITLDYWPGLVSAVLLSLLVFLLLILGRSVIQRVRLLKRATNSIQKSGDASGFQKSLGSIAAELNKGRSKDAIRLSDAFSEFRETLLEPSRDGEHNVRNAFRPSTFLNIDDLGYSLAHWRFWPGIFVSVGLLLTFLGLVAVLSSTQVLLPDGNVDQGQIISALRELLARASAKFIMSLTGLFCSILMTLGLRIGSNRLESAVDELAHALERRMDFVSLEGLADRQLNEIKEQSTQMQRLNSELIAAISKPLQEVANSSVDAVDGMVKDLSRVLTDGLGNSLGAMSDRIDGASEVLSSLSGTLSEAASRFEASLVKTTTGLDAAIGRLEMISDKLSSSAESVSSAVDPVMQTVKESSHATQRIAEGSVVIVNAAKTAIEAEREIVVQSTKSIEQMIRSFESRAAAYDGQLEKAFKTYTDNVARTIAELETHGDSIHKQFAEALATLQAVIENAKAFEPESEKPKLDGVVPL